ncbi:GAD-like domain-containing protein [Photobacterium kagoshimensis]|uniref:GAD-like domain-containing protein n=1 Tax=Photobacterium kagoshimensis TaxID=2910242 RepID=UPI003D0D357B
MITEFKLDEDFEYFLEKFGEPFTSIPCSPTIIDQFKDKLPDRLLEYWQAYGFCGFKQGLFWIVNPAEYEDILDEWLEHTDIPDNDIYHVIARNAFGDLFLWGEETGYKYEITVANGWIIEKDGKPRKQHHIAIERFFGFARVDSHDITSESGKPLFNACIKKHGALGSDEMFGFAPSLIVGGESELANLSKVNIFVHLSILAQFGQIEVLDHKALMRKAFI